VGELSVFVSGKDINVEDWGSSAYNCHPYHTKVHPSIYKQLIEQNTNLGDVILDPFSGSGIIAYCTTLLNRNGIIQDLSPYCVHIGKGYSEIVNPDILEKSVEKILLDSSVIKDAYILKKNKTNVSYYIWSNEYRCDTCETEFTLNPNGSGRSYSKITCPNVECKKLITPEELISLKPIVIAIKEKTGKRLKNVEYQLTPQEQSNILNRFSVNKDNPYRKPMMGVEDGVWGEQFRNGNHDHVRYTSDFYTDRNWELLNILYQKIARIKDVNVRQAMLFGFTGSLYTLSRMVRCRKKRDGRSNTPGTLYCPPIFLEQNVLKVWERRMKKVISLKKEIWLHSHSNSDVDISQVVRRGDATKLQIPDNSIDYIVTDPPFGDSLQYAELNFIPEAFLGSFTKVVNEAVVNNHRKRSQDDYLGLMQLSFQEMHRVLKSDGKASIIFNNTNPNIWKGIKRGLLEAGFEITGATHINKGKGSWNQVNHASSTSRFDPVIHVKPKQQNSNPNNLVEIKDSKQKTIESVRIILSCESDKMHLSLLHSAVVRAAIMDAEVWAPPSPKILLKRIQKEYMIEKNQSGTVFVLPNQGD
jgi:DNA modification methylase